MASFINAKLLPQIDWRQMVTDVLNSITSQGNVLGSMRRAEVEDLACMIESYVEQCSLNSGNFASAALPTSSNSAGILLSNPFFDEWTHTDGLSRGQILGLVDALDPQALSQDYYGFQQG